MNIQFKTTHAEDFSSKELHMVTEFAKRKVQGLKKHLGKEESPAHVYVELGKDSRAHQNGNIWRAQLNIDNNGKRFHADAVAERIETAVIEATKELDQELRKAKQRQKSMIRKEGSSFKAFLRGFRIQ